ncbi:MAG: hypothetical protein U5R06_15245 [candidate division KSB1 bacterium]|nr:hypothetical protein [candidate division KSB1 bacterium]
MDMENLLRVTVRGWTDSAIYPENSDNGQHAGNEVWQHDQAIVQDGSIRGRIDMPNGVMWMYCDDGADRVYKNCPLKNINPKGWMYTEFLNISISFGKPIIQISPWRLFILIFGRGNILGQDRILLLTRIVKVTLFVNQKKIATKYPDKNNFFIVNFENTLIEPGELKVVGKKQNEMAEFKLPMAGKPEKLRLTVSHSTIEAARNSVVTVAADAVDKEGVQVQDFNNSLQWKVQGPATLVGPAYWETDIHKKNADSGCWYMTAPVLNMVRSDGTPGVITIIVSFPGLDADTIKIYAIPKIIERNSLREFESKGFF